MAISFNADEIFEMAEEIERNAAKFYREAAKNTDDEAMKKVFLDLAVMEDGHIKVFKEMRSHLDDSDREPMLLDPDNEAALYLQSMADSHGSEGKKDLKTKLSGKESAKEVLVIAVNAENNSIVFYTVLKGLVTPTGKEKIEEIISEEVSHLVILKMQLTKLS
jgi:rubrerythrin